MHNSTIISKKKNLLCGHFDFNFSKGRCKSCATIEDSLNRINEVNNEDGLPELIAECDALFSKYIRLKYADNNGNEKCYTCDSVNNWRYMQNGHYKSRTIMFLRFDERNCRPQCEFCNCHKHGNLAVFGRNLEEEKPGITEILEEEMRLIYKYTREELKQLKRELTSKVNNLKP